MDSKNIADGDIRHIQSLFHGSGYIRLIRYYYFIKRVCRALGSFG